MRVDPQTRPTFAEIFCHPWILKYKNKLNIDIERLRYKEKKNKEGFLSMNNVGEFMDVSDHEEEELLEDS